MYKSVRPIAVPNATEKKISPAGIPAELIMVQYLFTYRLATASSCSAQVWFENTAGRNNRR